MLSKCWIKDSTGHLKPYMNAIHHYRGAQLIVVTQYHASVVLGFDATFTTLTDHTKITTYTMYLNKKIFLLPLIIIFRSYEQKSVIFFFFFFECDCRRYENWVFFFHCTQKTHFWNLFKFFPGYMMPTSNSSTKCGVICRAETVEYKQGAERSKKAWHLHRPVFSLTDFPKHTVLLVKQVSQVSLLSSSKVLNSSVLFDTLSSPNKCE